MINKIIWFIIHNDQAIVWILLFITDWYYSSLHFITYLHTDYLKILFEKKNKRVCQNGDDNK